jgi:hypothetical protein
VNAKVITEWVWSSAEIADRNFGLDDVLGDLQIKRLLVEDRNLVITPDGGNVYAYYLEPDTKYEVIGEADVPDELVDLAERVAKYGNALRGYYASVSTLVQSVKP